MGLENLIPGIENPTDVVTPKVFIEDTELNNEIALMQLSVNKSFNKIASAQLLFMDGSVADREFKLSNNDTFKPGSKIRIELGYRGNVETVFEGMIIKHGVKVKQNGISQLIIEAKDKAVTLTSARKSKYFIDKTDSAIITELLQAFESDVMDTQVKHKQLVQFEATDWDFIVTRAEANSMLVFTDDGKLIIKKPSLTEAVLTARYGQNIYEFDAEMDARRQVHSITGHSWDYTQQAAVNSKEGEASFTETGNLSAAALGDVLKTEINLSHTGYLTQEQLQGWADAYAMRNQLSKAVGRVRVQGNAAVKPGTTITLEDVSDRFNGDVYVTGVLHQYDGNWYTDIQFGWQEDWFYKNENVMQQPAAGLLPGINGLQIGVVVNVDDAEGGQYRVKVHVPMITTGKDGIWARVATLDAGKERGVYFRPEKNDEVILGFLNDDPREAVILGYLHSKDAKKSPLPETKGNLEFGIVTKEKLKLIFDDTNKKITLSVPGKKEKQNSITMDASGIVLQAATLEFKDENQNSIKMNAEGITINAAKKATLIGKKVDINP